MNFHFLLAYNMARLSKTIVRALFICEVTKITESCLYGSNRRSFSSLRALNPSNKRKSEVNTENQFFGLTIAKAGITFVH